MDEILKYLPLFSPLSVFLWFLIRKEVKTQIAKSREEQREYTDHRMKELRNDYDTSSLRKDERIDRLSDRIVELEKAHAMEIALLRQTASTTDKRLDTIEARIEKLDEKFDEQKELLHKIHSIIKRGGIQS
ncbi:hypothetical protein [Leptospira noguchii]|uniref:hypothetical protein n=1 Tax=Leptospira noguchii TaxID=28182 RepID=UPI0007745F77|nr:hypothetical protein [Leptospira noguchii]UOG42498.1 hypothetical protein MAL05_05450 [Leptospira noguchii]UOG58993.1 hypothetical protein MAL07_09070 [Leptospira noguchii]